MKAIIFILLLAACTATQPITTGDRSDCITITTAGQTWVIEPDTAYIDTIKPQ